MAELYLRTSIATRPKQYQCSACLYNQCTLLYFIQHVCNDRRPLSPLTIGSGLEKGIHDRQVTRTRGTVLRTHFEGVLNKVKDIEVGVYNTSSSGHREPHAYRDKHRIMKCST